MESVIARVPASSPVTFEDGLGQRRVTAGIGGDPLEILTLREELTAIPTFETKLRDRVSRLADFHSEHFARVRGVEKLGKGGSRVALVSDHIPGVRLSQILEVAESRLLPVETNAALCLMRQLVHAVAVLHDKAPDLCHGTIGPERLVITPLARLVVVEHVLGSAIEQLRYSNKQYWQQLRVPLQRTLGVPHFDRRSDVTQVGATALALIIGRPLADDEFPSRAGDMTGSALELSADGGLEPLPLPLRVWLQRALQIDSRTPFSSALEAWAELDRVLHYSDPIAEMDALKLFLTRYYAAVGAGGTVSDAAPMAPSAPEAPRTTVAAPTRPAAARTPLTTAVPLMASSAPLPTTQTPSTSPMPTTPPQAAAPTPPASPEPTTPRSPIWDRPMPKFYDTPPDAGTESGRQAVPAALPTSRLRLAAAAVLLIALTSGVTLAARRFLMQPVAANGMGTLVVQTNPGGAAVEIDGQQRGVTPLSLDLAPGRHTLKLSSEGNSRSMPITIAAGGHVSQFIELPRVSSVLGELRIRTEPAGAKVTVDGHAYGKSPLTVEGLAPGAHTVLLENDLGSITQEVKIEPGTTASLMVPLTTPKNAPLSGWISVKAPVEVQIFEDDRLLGTSQSDRIMVSVGRHRLEIVSEALGYRNTQTVTVGPGRVSPVTPAWPRGSMSLNAIPWAEVWVDGQQVGETPLANVAVPIGAHEVVFRHPDLGEKRVRTVVALGAPAKVSVDLRQR